MKKRAAPPKATALIESLRGLGYSAATAIADVIDNSIAAGANNVDIGFSWAGDGSCITILDDGVGMSDSELDLAMRLGEKNPLTERKKDDLGRFGLGLKTASFSQCRLLTVASRKNNAISCLRWDLDLISDAEDGGWVMYEGVSDGNEHLLDPLRKALGSGTLVIWQKLDRLMGKGMHEKAFLDLIDDVECHLSMIFHRFLAGSARKVSIRINGLPLRAWDPFLSSNPSTWASPVERIQTSAGEIQVQAYVLPHKDKLDAKQYELAAGPDGWTAQQGFYVYRNQRLLVAGSWLGLGARRAWTKEESHRLARIRLDIPNSADDEWKIDIRKSRASPPQSVRTRLTHIAEDTRGRARKVFAFRGNVERKERADISHGWRIEHLVSGIRYRIDEDHPAVRAVIESSGEMLPAVKAMLRVIEGTVPVQRIWLDTVEAKETPRSSFAAADPEEILSVLQPIFRNLTEKKGLTVEEARQRLLRTEPFDAFPDLVMALDN